MGGDAANRTPARWGSGDLSRGRFYSVCDYEESVRRAVKVVHKWISKLPATLQILLRALFRGVVHRYLNHRRSEMKQHRDRLPAARTEIPVGLTRASKAERGDAL